MINAIIIDDEKLGRELITKFLEKHSDIKIISECSNGFEGVKAVNELKPDLVFLDIQMPKLTGFEMLEILDHFPQIVFSTAYDEFAIKAFEVNAVDYLLKPYSQERFDEAVEKVKIRLNTNFSSKQLIENLRDDSIDNRINKITVTKNNEIVFIDFKDMFYLEAQDDYVQIFSSKGKFLKKRTMKFFEENLPQNEFVRIHRSYIARIEKIKKLEKFDKDNYHLLLIDNSKLPVSRSGYNLLKSILNI
jgi:two-component system LytT family response regulator